MKPYSQIEAQQRRNHNKLRIMSKDIQAESELQYNAHIGDRCDSWTSAPKSYLAARLIQEVGEFLENPSVEEAADVLNFLAMIIATHTESRIEANEE